MEMKTPQIVEAMQGALLRQLGDEVDLIFQYGSQLKGSAHRYSDIDISYVPAHETTRKSITVMVDQTMIDLYPMQWSHLERMAEFDDLSSMVLLENRIVYQRSVEAAQRLRTLSARLMALLQPEARPNMIRKAQAIYQRTSYAHYLLCQEAAGGHWLGCIQQAQSILKTTLYCLAVCNQACIDTRKMDQVLALPKLPTGFAESVEQITVSVAPAELQAACEALLQTTRELLLAEQRKVLCHETSYPAVFDSGFPELMGDLQRVMLACERKDMLSLKTSLISLYHELSLGIGQVLTGIEYSNFNSLSEYEQDLVALGFPDLLPYLSDGDFVGLHRQCLAFGQHLKRFLAERSVELNWFATPEALQAVLAAGEL